QLPPGEYEVTSSWRFYRPDDNGRTKVDTPKSRIRVKIKAGETLQAPDLVLIPAQKPDILPAKGILADFDPQKPQFLDALIKTYQDFYEIPGVSLALIKDGKVIYHQTYGYKNYLTKEPVNGNTLFEAASISKPVFAFAVLRLAERGIIDLDKPLHTYLTFPDIAYDERYKLMTARHVLSHQTGFPNWASNNPDGKIDLKFTPGQGYGYSGEGFEYLKRVVAHITQKDMDDILQEEVLDPLGLKPTYYSKTDDYLQKVVANGHYDNLPTRASLPAEPRVASSMHTEAKIFCNFILGVQNRKVLKPETYAEMFKKHTEIPEDDRDHDWEEYFGLGLLFEKAPHGKVFQHGGNNGDFKCQFKMYEDLNMGFAIFTNSEYGDELTDHMDELLITGKKTKK
ncbi:MAG: serine hydrolase domain-containing protein, partial [Bacteroidota bacterium]